MNNQCPLPTPRCPALHFLCQEGPAAGGCFLFPEKVPPADCRGFATVPCDAQRHTTQTTTTPGPPHPSPTPPTPATPAPVPTPFPDVPAVQTSRLRITNGCASEPMWIAHMAGGGKGHDPWNVRVPPSASYDFEITDGLSSARYWPKLGCNDAGAACRVGDSGGPGQACDPRHGCAPPVDTKFEATFGTVGRPCNASAGEIAGCDWLDMSLVDGFTLPFKLDVLGGSCNGEPEVDCSALRPSHCPSELQVRQPGTGALAGCYSPCARLTYSNWGNPAGQHSPRDTAALPYCCPTPPVTPQQCSDGPVASSPYVRMVHKDCPGVYAYAYDDAEGLSHCTAGARYHVTFYCPGV